jgi:undecaprenyl-diphosphatase
MEDGITGVAYMALGVVSLVSGLWSRTGYWLKGARAGLNKWQATVSALLIAYGLAAMTTSPLVLSAVGFVCLASWFGSSELRREPGESVTKGSVLRESAMIGSLLLALLILLDARGVLPFQ